MTSRDATVGEAFVSLADTLVRDFDLTEVLHRLTETCLELVRGDDAGILIADVVDNLRVVGASREEVRLLELFELQREEGPCLDCYRSGLPISEPDLSSSRRWPRFAERARASGYLAVDAVPLRHRDDTIGALNVFGRDPGGLPEEDRRLAQALADVATIAIMQQRVLQESQVRATQLQAALTSRIVIEQAKGMLAEQGGVQVGAAFEVLRGVARARSAALNGLATDVVAGRLTWDDLVS